MAISEQDLVHLRACVALAREALEAGDGPFGTVLVDADGTVLWSGRNHDGGPATRPSIPSSRWPSGRRGSHPRSARAAPSTPPASTARCAPPRTRGWASAGSSTPDRRRSCSEWRASWGLPPGPVAVLPINVVAPGLPTDGPAPELEEELKALHRAAYER